MKRGLTLWQIVGHNQNIKMISNELPMKTALLTALTAATTATALLSFSAPAKAAFSFGTGGISFDRDTTVNFTFVSSQGAARSSLQIFNVSNLTNSVATLFNETRNVDVGGGNNTGWLGTFRSETNTGGAVVGGDASRQNPFGSITQSFKFLAGQVYTLGLVGRGGGAAPLVFSTSSLNSSFGGSQQAVFGSTGSRGPDGTAFDGSPFQAANPFAGGVAVSFDDRGGRTANDRDFQDFTVMAEAEVPEPLTMGGLLLGGAGLAYARRRRSNQESEKA